MSARPNHAADRAVLTSLAQGLTINEHAIATGLTPAATHKRLERLRAHHGAATNLQLMFMFGQAAGKREAKR